MKPFILEAIEGDPMLVGGGRGREDVSGFSPFITATASSMSLSYLTDGDGDGDNDPTDSRWHTVASDEMEAGRGERYRPKLESVENTED